MAEPIRPTPILRGKDAERFIKEMNRKQTQEEMDEKEKFISKCIETYNSAKPKIKCPRCGHEFHD